MFPGVMSSGGNNLNKNERELLKLFKALGESDQQTLVAFAQFLDARATTVPDGSANDPAATTTKNDEIPSQPLSISRPDEESVIKAIKRLTATYPMVDKENILHPISNLMTSHMIQGKSAPDVIDELEIVFLKEYEAQSAHQKQDDQKMGDQINSINKKSDK